MTLMVCPSILLPKMTDRKDIRDCKSDQTRASRHCRTEKIGKNVAEIAMAVLGQRNTLGNEKDAKRSASD